MLEFGLPRSRTKCQREGRGLRQRCRQRWQLGESEGWGAGEKATVAFVKLLVNSLAPGMHKWQRSGGARTRKEGQGLT